MPASGSRHFAWAALTNVATLAVGLATSTLLARLLGPGGRGELAQIQTWPSLIAGIAALGLPTAAAYFASREPGAAGRVYSTTLAMLMAWTVPVCAAAYLLMPWMLQAAPAAVVTAARWYLIIIPIQFAIAVPSSTLQGLQAFRAWNLLRFQGPMAWLIAVSIAFLAFGGAPESIALLYLVVMFIVALVFLSVVPRVTSRPFTIDLSAVPRLVRYGLASVSSVIPQQLNLRLDQALMAALMPSQVLGTYVVAVAWAGAATVPLAAAAGQVLFPWLASRAHDPTTQRAALKSVFRLALTASVILSGLLIVSTPFALPLVFGQDFSGAVLPAAILVVAAAITAIGQIAAEALRGLGRPALPTIAEMAGLLVTLSLLPWALRHYGSVGAASVSLLSYSTSLVVLVVAISRISQLGLIDLMICRRSDLIALRERLRAAAI